MLSSKLPIGDCAGTLAFVISKSNGAWGLKIILAIPRFTLSFRIVINGVTDKH